MLPGIKFIAVAGLFACRHSEWKAAVWNINISSSLLQTQWFGQCLKQGVPRQYPEAFTLLVSLGTSKGLLIVSVESLLKRMCSLYVTPHLTWLALANDSMSLCLQDVCFRRLDSCSRVRQTQCFRNRMDLHKLLKCAQLRSVLPTKHSHKYEKHEIHNS